MDRSNKSFSLLQCTRETQIIDWCSYPTGQTLLRVKHYISNCNFTLKMQLQAMIRLKKFTFIYNKQALEIELNVSSPVSENYADDIIKRSPVAAHDSQSAIALLIYKILLEPASSLLK